MQYRAHVLLKTQPISRARSEVIIESAPTYNLLLNPFIYLICMLRLRRSLARLSSSRTMSSPSRYPIHQLPLPSKTLQANLEQIPLPEDTPSHQRRSQTFTRTGIWARVTPLPLEFPFNLPSLSGKSREECENRQEEQVDAEALFRAFDDYEQPDGSEIGLLVKSSKRRNEAFTPELLGISSACLEQCLPHLDVDLAAVKQYTAGVTETLPDHLRSLVDIMSGRAVLRGTVKSDNRKEMNYGPWSTRYAGENNAFDSIVLRKEGGS